ncbi:Alg9-like mannosyltransferase family protein [Bradyrhizobium sp. YR681]|uniref:4-amino-4-deoxy-L-arabinose transferase n=1 Tax=Bradyrhizobium sp. YR681 TaxID=1144344 RepID=UPI00026FB1AF|nr:4-amino-4-deoxy-L-arabinose transferase [Bradyrhizobium sp. YR681]EJN07488.1 Alg9-like mannosyltransferase family protein [Bradyrhizobium sp. YR681]
MTSRAAALPIVVVPAVRTESFAARYGILCALLLLAMAVRLPLAFWPNINHNDEIYQYLEPAWRLLGHPGVVTWEWRDGIRSWFLPSLFAGPVALGDWLAPGGWGAFVVPRLMVGLASLSIVVTAWHFGERISRSHAVVAALAATVWFELVYFAPHTLSETLATAVILPAAYLLTGELSRKRLVTAGGLLALACVWRFQYAPACAVFALGACWSHPRRAIALMAGACVVLALAAGVDMAHGTTPFAWLVLNIQQNLLHDRASEFGVAPAFAYVHLISILWSGATLLMLLALWRGWRHAPLLIVAALVNIAFHSMIVHKEYRFIFLSIVLLVVAAGLGSADWAELMRRRDGWRLRPLAVVCAGWVLLSLGLSGATHIMRDNWMRGIGEARLAADLDADAEFCGLALYGMHDPFLPGRGQLASRRPVYSFYATDPLAQGQLPALVKRHQRDFNRVIGPAALAGELPADFSQRSCAMTSHDIEACVFARRGACDVGASPFGINDVLQRLNY